uniref:uncharacterized protein LOC117603493 n=1 Tax=Osmia lignaria TaxID=473952 RepID=UPI00147865D4|nr:uncharacterized protein LOC117603493 [Osmia lignaria]
MVKEMLRTKCHWVYLDERVNKGQESKAFVKPEEACSSSFSLHLDQTSNINGTFQTLKKRCCSWIVQFEIGEPLKFNSNVQSVKLPAQGQKQSGQAILSGWGLTSKSIRPTPEGCCTNPEQRRMLEGTDIPANR